MSRPSLIFNFIYRLPIQVVHSPVRLTTVSCQIVSNGEFNRSEEGVVFRIAGHKASWVAAIQL